MTSPSISIIVPIYNAAPFLDECLNSIISQSFPDFEVLLVNDGSTDASAEICKKYCANDSRFKYIEIHGRQGSGPARNRGLAGATGRYVVFCDSDDAYSKNALKLLFENAEKYKSAIVGGNIIFMDYTLKKNVGLSPTLACLTFMEEKVIPFEKCPALWLPVYHQRFLLERDFLLKNKILYPSLLRGQDPPFLAHAFCHAQNVLIIPDVVYFIRGATPGIKKLSSALAINDYIAHFMHTYKIFYEHNKKDMADFYLAQALSTVLSFKFLLRFKKNNRKKLISLVVTMLNMNGGSLHKEAYYPYDIDTAILQQRLLQLKKSWHIFLFKTLILKIYHRIKNVFCK